MKKINFKILIILIICSKGKRRNGDFEFSRLECLRYSHMPWLAMAFFQHNNRQGGENLQQRHILLNSYSNVDRIRTNHIVRNQPMAPRQTTRRSNAHYMGYRRNNHVLIRIRRFRRFFTTTLLEQIIDHVIFFFSIFIQKYIKNNFKIKLKSISNKFILMLELK